MADELVLDQTVKLEENVDFELIIPTNEIEGAIQDHWHVRLLTGDYPETVIEFGTVKVAEDGQTLNYNFEVVSSPDPDLKAENMDLQQHAANVLISVLERAVENMAAKEKSK